MNHTKFRCSGCHEWVRVEEEELFPGIPLYTVIHGIGRARFTRTAGEGGWGSSALKDAVEQHLGMLCEKKRRMLLMGRA